MSYKRTTRFKSYKDKQTGQYVEMEPIFTDEEAGKYLKNNRKGFTIYFDECKTWENIPPEQFKDMFFRFVDYAKSFNRETFPDELWYLQSIYDAKCNRLDRDADKYLDTQALKVKGGRNSAKARAKQQEPEPEPEQEPEGESPMHLMLLKEFPEARKNMREFLQGYAMKYHLWVPSAELCEEVQYHYDMFEANSLLNIIIFLKKRFEGETDENAISVLMDRYHDEWKRAHYS